MVNSCLNVFLCYILIKVCFVWVGKSSKSPMKMKKEEKMVSSLKKIISLVSIRGSEKASLGSKTPQCAMVIRTDWSKFEVFGSFWVYFEQKSVFKHFYILSETRMLRNDYFHIVFLLWMRSIKVLNFVFFFVSGILLQKLAQTWRFNRFLILLLNFHT